MLRYITFDKFYGSAYSVAESILKTGDSIFSRQFPIAQCLTNCCQAKTVTTDINLVFLLLGLCQLDPQASPSSSGTLGSDLLGLIRSFTSSGGELYNIRVQTARLLYTTATKFTRGRWSSTPAYFAKLKNFHNILHFCNPLQFYIFYFIYIFFILGRFYTLQVQDQCFMCL